MGRPAVWQGLSPCPARFSEMRNSSRTGSSQNHMSRVEPQHSEKGEIFVLGLWGVRYQVEDVVRSVVFYTEGWIQIGPAESSSFRAGLGWPSQAHTKRSRHFGLTSNAGRSKTRAGGWNRIVLQVEDLLARIEALQEAGVHFRNQMEVRPGGRQIQVEDPDGNPVELFEPAKR